MIRDILNIVWPDEKLQLRNLPPPDDDGGGGGGGGGGGTAPGTFGGTSAIIVIDATHFDIVSPQAGFVAALVVGSSYHGTFYSTTAPTAYYNGSWHWAFGAFGGDEGYPQCVAYHQQRRVFASTANSPQTVWMSKVGGFPDFGVSSPVQDDDAVTFTLNSGQLNAVRGMLSLRKLLLLTSDNEWVVAGGDKASVTPSSIQCDIQGYRGSTKLIPVGVGNVALYVQAKGQVIRDIGYDFASDSFSGNDLTVMASHLVQGKEIVEWAYQEAPFKCLWSVRDDGMLLGTSYLREQQVVGWHRHDTDGEFESVCVVPEGNEDVLYVTVKRTINGVTKRFVERMESRFFDDPRDGFFVDCGSTFDGRTGYRGTATDHTATTMQLWGGTAWDETEVLTIYSSADFFVGGSSEGDQIVYEDADGNIYRFTISAVTNARAATGSLNRQIPVAYRNSTRTDWYVARNSISGLDYLEGKTVAVFADGFVQNPKVVTSGTITLDPPAFIAHIGLPYTSDIQTLEVMDTQSGVSIGKNKKISAAAVMVEDARSIKVGRDFEHLETQKSTLPVVYDKPTSETGTLKVSFPTPWSIDGSMCIRNTDPTPLTILGLIPDITVGG